MSGTVLVVDDSLTVRMDLMELLEGAGLPALACATGGEARQALAERQFSLVILDVLLPDADGIELLSEIRAMPGAGDTPVMLLSSEAEIRHRIRGLTTGADEYIGKPYEPGYVIARARELVRRGQAAAAHAQETILIIDDSMTFREKLKEALEGASYRVLVANTGEDGLRVAAAERPAAAIVDGVLPGIDGATVIRRIRLDAALRRLPCLLLTASEDLKAEVRALDAGADAFVRKDEDIAIILARLNAVLRSAGAQAGDQGTASLQGPKKILAVDDSETYLQEVAAALRGDGYEVVLARSGEEALELLAVQSVDCMLLDLLMPGIGGQETCRRVKAVPVMRDIPVVMLTALEDREAIIQGFGAGADDFIAKSSDLEVLRARVLAQIRRKQFEDENRLIREKLLRKELEASDARAAREVAEARAALVEELEKANHDLRETQSQLIQAAKMVSLGELVAGVAHEINNPLAFVMSHLDTVQRSLDRIGGGVADRLSPAEAPLFEKALTRLADMRGGLERVRDLVTKLRTFSRLDEGEFKQADMRDNIESVLAILQHRLGDTLVARASYAEDNAISCYPAPLNQVVMNLLNNAIDAVEGAGSIDVRTERDSNAFRLIVGDSGPGLAPGIADRIFEPFFTTKPVGKGMGLGLAISYRIVQAHKGTIEARNKQGGGAEFVVTIPLGLRETSNGT